MDRNSHVIYPCMGMHDLDRKIHKYIKKKRLREKVRKLMSACVCVRVFVYVSVCENLQLIPRCVDNTGLEFLFMYKRVGVNVAVFLDLVFIIKNLHIVCVCVCACVCV